MQVKVDAVGPEKTSQYGQYFGIKCGDVWYNVQGPKQDIKGKTFEATVKDNGKFKWAKLIKPIESEQSASNGSGKKSHLNQFIMAQAFDFWWEKVKALELNDESKASVLCSLLIATTNEKSKLEYELPDDDVPPPPADDDIPF